MRFWFNDRKTAQAAAFLVRLRGGSLNYMKLIKLLYLADRQRLIDHGVPLTGDSLVSMKHGPVLSRVLDLISEGPSAQPSAWFEYLSAPSGYSVAVRPDAPLDTDELSRAELRLLTAIDAQYGEIDKWALVDLLHKILPEWQDPGDSVLPIEPETILRFANKSEEEIEDARAVSRELWLLSSAA